MGRDSLPGTFSTDGKKRQSDPSFANRPPSLGDEASGSEEIIRLIQQGEEPKRIFAAIVELSVQVPGSTGAALYLPSEEGSNQPDCIACDGDFTAEQHLGLTPESTNRIALPLLETQVTVSVYGSIFYHTFPITNLGTQIGQLVVRAEQKLDPQTCQRLTLLSHHAGMVFERQRLTGTVQHFLDRLQVLNQLNGLIASNAPVPSVVKNVARESAFRFAADVSFTLLLNDEKTGLEVLRGGGYGCAPQLIPPIFKITEGGILSQVMHLGGHLSVPQLRTYENHGLGFLENLGIQALDAHCLEVRGDPLGILLIGFKRPSYYQ